MSSSKEVVFTGLVEDVFIGGVNDVVIRLNKDPKRYFMNRGLEEGLTISQIRKDLINQVVVIETKPEGFNLFDIYDFIVCRVSLYATYPSLYCLPGGASSSSK